LIRVRLVLVNLNPINDTYTDIRRVFFWGYRDSLFETAQETVTIAANRGSIVSAIDVTAKTFFERLYLVLGLRKIAP